MLMHAHPLLASNRAACTLFRNFYACEIDESVFERQMDAMVDRSRMVDGKPTSLLDLGYNTVGIGALHELCPSDRLLQFSSTLGPLLLVPVLAF